MPENYSDLWDMPLRKLDEDYDDPLDDDDDVLDDDEDYTAYTDFGDEDDWDFDDQDDDE